MSTFRQWYISTHSNSSSQEPTPSPSWLFPQESETTTKTCTQCKELKHINDFYNRQNKCIACSKAYYRVWYEIHGVEFNYKNRINNMLGKKSFGRSAHAGNIEWLTR